MSFPFYKQHDTVDCGPTCLRMVAMHYGKQYSLQALRDKSGLHREGVSLLGLSEAAESIELRTLCARLSYDDFVAKAPLPCIVHWKKNHFVVVYRITTSKRPWGPARTRLHIADPALGMVALTPDEFRTHWLGHDIGTGGALAQGITLLLEPTARFRETEGETSKALGFRQLFHYLLGYKQLLVQLLLGLLVGSGLQLLFPFLTQAVVDTGIRTHDLSFVYLVLLAQLLLFASRAAVEFIRGWILLHIGARINLSILSDFLVKLMRLPLSFFDVKLFGDIIRRINDHQRIEQFLTTASLSVVFSLVNLLAFSIVLAYYSTLIFVIFLSGSLLYGCWAVLFLGRRRRLDFRLFEEGAKNQSTMVQLIQGMQEIKLNNSENLKRWEWDKIQARVFYLNVESLALNQYQQAGAFFLNEGKNILITFLAAKSVLDGQLTLGAMLAVQYIIGQLNSPVEQLVQFLQSLQNAKISLERLNDIHQLEDEEPASAQPQRYLPDRHDFTLRDVSFHYPGSKTRPALKNVSLHIPQGKVTAIVGTSGSGKTTLLKLLLKFYTPTTGDVYLDNTPLDRLSQSLWRSQCGVVMQEGFIFSDTIARNVAVGDEYPDARRLAHAIKVANIEQFVQSLPLGYHTKIGAEGNGISQGQRQRILIARAVYKNPAFIFFDEATNALDSNNERVIMRNLEEFFEGRTVVVVAHRLSTVMNADQIIVIDQGEVVEQGTHYELVANMGNYYNLVKNQLEVGA